MLNNDTEPGPGWLDELLYVFKSFPDAGLAGAKLVYPNGKLQEAGGIVFPNFDIWNYGRDRNPYESRFNYTRQVDYVSGACIMISRAVWEKLGGFDEFFAPAYYEDTDLAFRIRALGLKTYYTPFAEVVHFEGLSNGTSTASGMKRYQAVNEPKFRRRWAGAIRALAQTDPELAKDRGVELRALVIDYKTPEPDKDAGSYAAVQEMRLLQSLGFKLTFVARNLAYMGNYTESLQRRGVECLYAPYQTSVEEVIRRRGSEFDVFYITRYDVTAPYIDAIRAAAPRGKIVFCNADLHFLREIRAAIVANNRELLSAALATRDAELAVMQARRRHAVLFRHRGGGHPVAQSRQHESRALPVGGRGRGRHAAVRGALRPRVPRRLPACAQRGGRPVLRRRDHAEAAARPPRPQAAHLRLEHGRVDHEAGGAGRRRRRLCGAGRGRLQPSSPVRRAASIRRGPEGQGRGRFGGGPADDDDLASPPRAWRSAAASRRSSSTAPDAWVKAIVSLYDDEARWSEMSERAKNFARENFSFERGVETMRAALVGGGGLRGGIGTKRRAKPYPGAGISAV